MNLLTKVFTGFVLLLGMAGSFMAMLLCVAFWLGLLVAALVVSVDLFALITHGR